MRMQFCGLVLTMIAQPTAGIDSFQFAYPKNNTEKERPLAQTALRPVVMVAQHAAFGSKLAALAPTKSAPTYTVTNAVSAPNSNIRAIEFNNGEKTVREHDGIVPSSPELKVSAAAQVAIMPPKQSYHGSSAKSPEQKAQDTWDARQQLAYFNTIPSKKFDYLKVYEAAPGEMRVVSSLDDQHNTLPNSNMQPQSGSIEEIQNNKSQASSALTAEHEMELLP